MRFHHLLFSACLVFGSTSAARAQQPSPAPVTGTISGGTLSGGTHEPVVAANVRIRRMSDTTIVKSVITNSAGRFTATALPFGEYLIEVTSIGHAPARRENVRLSAANPARDVGEISMPVAAVQLEGLTARGQRSAVALAPDRSVYNIRDMPVVQGGYATDALRAIPELEVDIDDNIRARGGEPLIMLDGRPLPMQGAERTAFLRSLSADRIDRIEYIPNPSARYEAEGQSGIVNIVLRRDASLGLSGSVAANAGTRGTQNASTRLNYQKGRVTFFGGGLLGFNQSNSSVFDLRQNLITTPVTYLHQSAERDLDGMHRGADMTTEVKLSDRSTVWTVARGNWGGSDEAALTEFIHLDAQQDAVDRYERENLLDSGRAGYSGAVGFRRVVETRRDEFSTELRYNANHSDGETENFRYPHAPGGGRLDVEPDLTRIGSSTRDGLLSFQADLSRPLSTSTRVDVGYRGNTRTHRDTQGLTLFRSGSGAPEVDQDDRYHYDEDSHAAYVTLEQQWGKLSLQGGVRAERISGLLRAPSLTEEVDFRHSDLFPSANLAYDLGGGRQLRLAYSQRIQRPSAGVRNPINTTAADPFNRSVGNPHLQPADIHTVSVDGSWTGALGTLRVSPFYFHGTGLWDRVRSVDESGTSTTTPRNVASASQYGINLNGSVREVGPVSGFVGLNLNHLQYDAGNLAGVPSGALTSWRASANITTTVSRTLRIQTTGGYSPGQLSPYGRRSASRQLNVALTQRLFADRGVLTLSLVDPFDLSRTTIRAQDPSFHQTVRTNNRVRRASLSLSYNFGRPPQSSRRVIQDEQSGGGMSGGDSP